MDDADIFEEVKSKVPILDYVMVESQGKQEKVGEDTWRMNPCPLCGHSDCFTIYTKTESFNCFSCGQAGDVICFERLYRSLPDNLEAARSIAGKRGIQVDAPGKTRQPKADTAKNSHSKPGKASGINENRANELRGIAVDFYHGQLLDDKRAFDYQTKDRGHNLEVLKAFRIGYAGRRSLIAAIKKVKGFSVEDLIKIGLVRKRGSEYYAVIPQGSFVYPQCFNDEVVYFSIKVPPSIKPFQIKKQYAGQGWLCFNQDVLNTKGPAVITEGENDALSLIDKARKPAVISTIGNFNTSNILTYLKDHAQGKVFYLCFDRDDAGRKYTSRYSKAIVSGGGEARIIEIPEPYKDVDELLRVSGDPSDDFEKLMKKARIISRPEGDSLHDDQGGPGSLVSLFKDFEILGEMADGRLAFWSLVKRKIYLISLKDFNLDALDQIGGAEIRYKVVRSMAQMQKGKIHFFALKRDVIIEAGQRLLGEEKWIGQGVSLLDDGRLLIISGDVAVIWDGVNFESYSGPMIEKKFLRRNPAEKWIDIKLLEKSVLKMDKGRAQEICNSAIEIINQWGFVSDYDVDLITGFLFAQMVQAIWDWRPHLWVSGPQGSGKTLLIELFDRIAGNLSRRYEGQTLTEAGFRQDIKHDFRLTMIDEFEKSDSRQELLNLLRSAGRGGSATKGTPSGKATHHSIRHMTLIASIERGLSRAAEKHRFINIEMRKDPDRNPKIPRLEEAEHFRMDFLSFALWSSFRAKKLIRQLPRLAAYEPRLVEAFAVPISMIAVTDPEPLECLKRLTQSTLDEQRETGEETGEDEQTLLEDILTSTIRVPLIDEIGKSIYSDRSINQLLEIQSDANQKNLQAFGIKQCRDGLFLIPQILERKLLRDTMWKGLNVRSILKRLPGAESAQRRVGGEALRGILLMDSKGKQMRFDTQEDEGSEEMAIK